jgi:integrase
MNDLVKPPSAELATLAARAAYYGKSTIADRTRHEYEMQWAHFQAWCERMVLPYNPPEVSTVAVYLAALADGLVEMHWADRQGRKHTTRTAYKWASIQLAYSGLIHVIRRDGHDWPSAIPAITKVMHGIKYRKGSKQRRVAPLEIADLRACLAKMNERRIDDLGVIRDRALLSLGFFSAMRRGELAVLRVEDLEFTKDGLIVTIRRSKTDQFAEGQTVGIKPQTDPKVCPIALLKRYLEVSELKAGPLFRRIDYRSDCMGAKAFTPQAVSLIVKARVEAAGLDPERFAGHSLRAGFVTTAAAKGVTLHNIMRQTRHKSERVAMSYIRPASVFRDNATDGLGDEEESK